MSVLKSFWKSIRKNKKIHLTLFLLISILFIGRCIDFRFKTNFINGGDTFTWLNFDLFIKKSLYIWESSATGRIPPMQLWILPYNLILQLLSVIFRSNVIAINVFWVFLIFFAQYSFYCFYGIFLKKDKSLLAALFSILNLYFLIHLISPVYHNIIHYIAFPLSFYLFYNYVNKKRLWSLFFYILFQLILFRTLNTFIVINLFVPLSVFLLISKRIAFKKYIKKVIITWMLTFLVVLPISYNFGLYYLSNDVSDNSALQGYNDSAVSQQEIYSLDNLFRLLPSTSVIYSEDDDETPGSLDKDYIFKYVNNPFFVVISYAFIIVFILKIIELKDDKENKKQKIILLVFILMFILLAKGINPPFEKFNTILYKNFIYKTLFRNSAKYFFPVAVNLIVLFIFWVKGISRKLQYLCSTIIGVYLLSNIAVVFIFSKPINKSWNTYLPNDYTEVTKCLDSLETTNNFLILPITKHFIGYTNYADGYTGPDRLYALTKKNLLTKIHSVVISNDYSKYIDNIRETYSLANDYPEILNYEYIILEKDTKYIVPGYSTKHWTRAERFINDNWDIAFENDSFKIFKIRNGKLKGKIYTNNEKNQITYKKINPTEYVVELENINETTLNFLETYNKNWNIEILGYDNALLCDNEKQYDLSAVKECKSDNNMNLNLRDIFSYKSNYDLEHKKGADRSDYANSWTIKKEVIVSTFDTKYYKINKDGSINIKFRIIFEPQKYYSIALIVCVITLLSVVFFCLYRENK